MKKRRSKIMSEKWNISFNDNFFENQSKKRGGTEQKINIKLNWGETHVHIPLKDIKISLI